MYYNWNVNWTCVFNSIIIISNLSACPRVTARAFHSDNKMKRYKLTLDIESEELDIKSWTVGDLLDFLYESPSTIQDIKLKVIK